MRPPSVYANPSCPARAGCPCDLTRLLHGPHRVALRLVMILLSQRGWTASAIAELLGCDPVTVRRWIHRYNTGGPPRWPTGPARVAPASAARPWPGGSGGCSTSRAPGRFRGCTSGSAVPP